MILWLAVTLAALSCLSFANEKPKQEDATKLASICRDQGGTWVITKHGQRGCKCPNGHYLKNVFFEVCHRSKVPAHPGETESTTVDPSQTTWGQKGQSWALSSQSRTLPEAPQLLAAFLQAVNSRDFDSALSLVNDYEVHPSRELDGVNELLRRFKSVSSREHDLRLVKTFGAVAEPQAQWSGCHYLEEFAATLVDGQDKQRAIGRITLYCAHLTAKDQGKHPIAQARRVCLEFKPVAPKFACKVGRVEMF